VDDILIEGIRHVRGTAQETMGMVYDAMGLYGPKLLRTYSLPLIGTSVPALPFC